jgi:hypothetical protein
MQQWQAMGWINTFLALGMGTIYPIKENMKTHKKLIPIYRKMRVWHPIVGVIMIAIGIYHGINAFGRILVLHSGPMVLLILSIMAVIALAGRKNLIFKKNWRKIHRTLGLLLYTVLLLHILFPWWL